MNPEACGIRLTRIAATDAALKITMFPHLSVLNVNAIYRCHQTLEQKRLTSKPQSSAGTPFVIAPLLLSGKNVGWWGGEIIWEGATDPRVAVAIVFDTTTMKRSHNVGNKKNASVTLPFIDWKEL